MKSRLHTVPAPVLLQVAATLYLQNAICLLPCRSDVGKQRDFGRLMHEAPIFALRLMQMSLEREPQRSARCPRRLMEKTRSRRRSEVYTTCLPVLLAMH